VSRDSEGVSLDRRDEGMREVFEERVGVFRTEKVR
jgi:hypothetical protein